MTDERDPLIHDALQRLARSAPAPRPDRLAAVVAGARRRQQVRLTASSLTAVAFVVAAAVGVHTWRDTAVQPVGPNPATSQPSPAVVSSPAALASPVGSPQQVQVGAQPSPTAAPSHQSAGALVATVKTVASLAQGDLATVVMTVTNKGSTETHGGTFVIQQAYARNAAATVNVMAGAFSSGCKAGSQGITCTVGALEPGHSRVFSDAVTPRGMATSVVFEVRWEYSPPSSAAVSTSFHRVLAVKPMVPSSPPVSPTSSGVPTSSPPSSSGAPSSELPTPPASETPKPSSSWS
jgi:hypothetical protein